MQRIRHQAWIAALALASGGASAAELQAYAGAVGGIAQGTGSIFACATSGPTIGNGWFAGVALPTEGFAGCNLAGGIVDKTAASGPLTAQQSVSAPALGGGSFTGAASAIADYGRLGVSANGTMTGATSSSTYHQTSGFARFQDTLTLSSAGLATGTAGAVDFAFLIEGLMQSLPNAPFTQQGDIALGIRVGTGVGNPARGPWYSFMGTVVNDGTPYLRGGGSGIPGNFVVTPGGFSGSAEVLSTANFGIQWGVPFEVEVALLTTVTPCCNGTSIVSDFYNTAVLSGISARAGGALITDFSVLSASGTAYGVDGVFAVPEPANAVLLLSGGLALLAWRRRSRVKAVT